MTSRCPAKVVFKNNSFPHTFEKEHTHAPEQKNPADRNWIYFIGDAFVIHHTGYYTAVGIK